MYTGELLLAIFFEQGVVKYLGEHCCRLMYNSGAQQVRLKSPLLCSSCLCVLLYMVGVFRFAAVNGGVVGGLFMPPAVCFKRDSLRCSLLRGRAALGSVDSHIVICLLMPTAMLAVGCHFLCGNG